jgi:hypothetical protein
MDMGMGIGGRGVLGDLERFGHRAVGRSAVFCVAMDGQAHVFSSHVAFSAA